MNSSRGTAVVAALVSVLGSATFADARQTADEIARAIVIGQAYTSGNVYVGGFLGTAAREWPGQLTVASLTTAPTPWLSAEFLRALVHDSEELQYFAQREDGGSAGPEDLFSTIDSMVVSDPNLALYRSATRPAKPQSIVGWDHRLSLTDLSFRDAGRRRPTTEAERTEIAADRNAAPPAADCTTEPQFFDSAEIILTAAVAATKLSIRLSKYATPGCAGHLTEIYILDVLAPGQQPRRFEFHHYVGLL